MDINILIHCNDDKQILCIINKYHSFYKSDFIKTIIDNYSDGEPIKSLHLNISSDTVKLCFSNADLKNHLSRELLTFLSLMEDNRIFDIIAHNIKDILSNKFDADFNTFVHSMHQEFIDKCMFSGNLILADGQFVYFDSNLSHEYNKYYNGSILPWRDDHTIVHDEYNKRIILPPYDYYNKFYYIPEYCCTLKRSSCAGSMNYILNNNITITIDMMVEENDIVYLLLDSTIELKRVIIKRITSDHAEYSCLCDGDNNGGIERILMNHEHDEWVNIYYMSDLQNYVKKYNYTVEICSDIVYDTYQNSINSYQNSTNTCLKYKYKYKIKMSSGFTSIFMYY